MKYIESFNYLHIKSRGLEAYPGGLILSPHEIHDRHYQLGEKFPDLDMVTIQLFSIKNTFVRDIYDFFNTHIRTSDVRPLAIYDWKGLLPL